MVSSIAPIAALFLAAAPAAAADWTQAGGPIFPGQPSQTPAAPAIAPGAIERSAAEGIEAVAPAGPPYRELIDEAAAAHGLDPQLLHALVLVESAYRPRAVSAAGAAGLTQLMPGTAADLGVTDRLDPRQNLFGGAAYLAAQLRRFGDVRLALAAYNAGPARVAAAGQIPRIRETQAFVTRVVDCLLALTAGRALRSPAACAAAEAAYVRRP